MRIDFYRLIHKAMRRELFCFSIEIAKLNLNEKKDIEHIQQKFSFLSRLLLNHAQHEDRFIHPLIEQVNRKTQNLISEEHHDFNQAVAALTQAFNECFLQDNIEPAKLTRFYERLNVLIADYLKHLDYEENIIMPLLWQNFDDEELMTALLQFIDHLTEEEKIESMDYLMPALNIEECKNYLIAMKLSCPAPAFKQMSKRASKHFARADWSNMLTEINATPSSL